MTELEKYLGARYATDEELNDFNVINKIFDTKDIDFVDKMIELIGDHIFAYKPEDIHRSYNKLYYHAKKLGTTVKALENWYLID